VLESVVWGSVWGVGSCARMVGNLSQGNSF
jgi:hypothetical protein